MLIINLFVFAHADPANFRTLVSVLRRIFEHNFAGQIRFPPLFSPFRFGMVVHVLPGVEQVEHPVLALLNTHIILSMSLVVLVHPRQIKTSFSGDVHKIIC